MKKAQNKMNGAAIKELGKSIFREGWTVLPKELEYKSGDRLLTVRGSGFALGFLAEGPIYNEAMKHPELKIFE